VSSANKFKRASEKYYKPLLDYMLGLSKEVFVLDMAADAKTRRYVNDMRLVVTH
jgi:hypothetical protein